MRCNRWITWPRRQLNPRRPPNWEYRGARRPTARRLAWRDDRTATDTQITYPSLPDNGARHRLISSAPALWVNDAINSDRYSTHSNSPLLRLLLTSTSQETISSLSR